MKINELNIIEESKDEEDERDVDAFSSQFVSPQMKHETQTIPHTPISNSPRIVHSENSTIEILKSANEFKSDY